MIRRTKKNDKKKILKELTAAEQKKVEQLRQQLAEINEKRMYTKAPPGVETR